MTARTTTLAALALISTAVTTAADITFRAFQEDDLPTLFQWTQASHVAPWWWSHADTYEKFVDEFHPNAQNKECQYPFMVLVNRQPVGYIQYYCADKLCKECWQKYGKPGAGTVGMDLIIGKASLIKKGLGTQIVDAFVAKVFAETDATRIIADPSPANTAAIRCFAKAGFERVEEIDAPSCVKTTGKIVLMARSR